MNLLSVENLSKSYGTKVLFDSISFGIEVGEKKALVARNGAGKTTLLRILAGKDTPDSGRVVFRNDIRTAILPQEPELDPEKSILEVVFASDSPIMKIVRDYEKALEDFQESQSEKNQDNLEKATAMMDSSDAWNVEEKVKQILGKLGLHDTHLKSDVLSGGQRKRVALAAVLIQEPDLIILDEPTNHLDLEMIEWLETYLSRQGMAMLLVTHDRYFLDRVSDSIIELEDGKIYHYDGDFSYFVEKKAERESAEGAAVEKARNLFRRELEWVRRMPKARGTKAKYRVDAFEKVKEEAQGKARQKGPDMSVKMTRLGGKILELLNLKKSFGSKKILDGFSYTFKKGEKIGIIGKNGVGKTTFLNMLLELEKPDSGKIQQGETVVFGYYRQEGMKLSEEKRVIEIVKDSAEFIPMADGSKLTPSQLLQRFNFAPDSQYSFVSKLSGGEKRRLYLLTILMKNPNFLILDEPTNDLDIMTLSVLEDFLADYPGCVIIVSHDRYFMDKLVDHLFVFEGEGQIRDFPGNYTQYRDSDYYDGKSKTIGSSDPKPEVKQVAAPDKPAETKKLSFKEKYEFEQLEKKIEDLEKEKTELEGKMNSVSGDMEEINKLTLRYSEVNNELDEAGMRWLELSEKTE